MIHRRPLVLAAKLTMAMVLAAGYAIGLPEIASAADPYPDQLPDFSHAAAPHSRLYSNYGGTTARPMLVIYVQWSDAPTLPAPAGGKASYAKKWFFGRYPSVRDYFTEESSGRLLLTRAAETSTTNEGRADDGVVVVTFPTPNDVFKHALLEDQLREVVTAADSVVDFSIFDTLTVNGDGTVNPGPDGIVTADELVAHFFFVGSVPTGEAIRGVAAGPTLDGVSVDGLPMSVIGTETDLMTDIHETGHIILEMGDLYNYGVGTLDLGGVTGGPGLSRTTTWQRMHIGWSYPTVVVRDGYYTVGRDDSYLLYDPDTGTDRYFMVEKRDWSDAYDKAASDRGLVIWRIDDPLYGSASDRPIDLRRPIGGTTNGTGGPEGIYGGSSSDAWDPSDPNTPQRTFENTFDGFPSVAVRAIPAVGDTMPVFFDVRGPGVLVDPRTSRGRVKTIEVTPEENALVGFRVRNTGESSDQFEFGLTALPPGWDATGLLWTLDPQTGGDATVQVTPAANAPTGLWTVYAQGQSTTDGSVSSNAPLRLDVVLDGTRVRYIGATMRHHGSRAQFMARVVDPDDPGTPAVAGCLVTFRLKGPRGTQTASAVTDSTGVASASPQLDVPAGAYVVNAVMPRCGKHARASDSEDYRVTRR